MSSHFSDIGFPVSDIEAFKDLVQKASHTGRCMRSPNGYYVCWSPGAGAELWAQANAEHELVGLHPHFAGAARMRMGLTDIITDPENPLDGSIRGWADPRPENPQSGAYPLMLDLPDFDLVRSRLRCPAVLTVQVAAFAHSVRCFADDASLYAWQDPKGGMAAESFIPIGLLPKEFLSGDSPSQQSDESPGANAFLSGHVRSHHLCANPETGNSFHHVHLRTLGGEVDVVGDPAVVSGEPVVGGVIQGTFWLSGRVQQKTGRVSAALGRLFGRRP
jgi:hypothetical protein